MDKYTGAKTIGDGTYGSVLKAINKQNGECLLAAFVTNLTYCCTIQEKSLQSKR